MKNWPVILVCGDFDGDLYIPDNQIGKCDICGRRVQYRPHAPKPHILRCTRCAADMVGPDDRVGTTKQMVKDAADYFRRRKKQ